MNETQILEQFNLILIRYGEIWLKSQKVKIRMMKTLLSNIKNMLDNEQVPYHKYQISKDSSRIFFFFKNEDLMKATTIIKRVFGIHSISPAIRTSNKLNNIIERALEIAGEILEEGDNFAVRVKRSGNHEFTSLQVAQIVGKEILDHFSNLKLKVNLGNPMKKIFIEIRGDFSYIFTEIIDSLWCGLPIELRKQILVMDIGRLTDLLAGFLMMRRGSYIIPCLFNIQADEAEIDKWIDNWKQLKPFFPFKELQVMIFNLYPLLKKVREEVNQEPHTCALCRLIRFLFIKQFNYKFMENYDKDVKVFTDGVTLNNSNLCPDNVDFESIVINNLISDFVIFEPVIGFQENEVNESLKKISKNFHQIDYCSLKPKNQIINVQKIIDINQSFQIENLVKNNLNIKGIVKFIKVT
jgi:thiamine biosynthesis protein ThiI